MVSTPRLSSSLAAPASASGVALAWIVAAHFFRHPGDTDPASVRLALSAMAVWFLACGVWARARAMTGLSNLFLLYCTLSAIHWGGPIGIGPEALQAVELAFFIVVGTASTQSVFVDVARRLALRAPDHAPALSWAPYAPAIMGIVLMIVFAANPANETLKSMIYAFYPIGVLLSLVGGVILIALPFRKEQNRLANSVVAAALFFGWVPHALVAGGILAANGEEGFFNLPLAIVPLALAWRIARRRRAEPETHP